MFKKYFLTACLLLTASVASANEFYATAPLASPHGTLIRNILAVTDYQNFQAKQPSGCGEGVSLFESDKNPVAIVWSNSAYRSTRRTNQNCVIDITAATPILEVRMPYQLCVKPGFNWEDQKGKKLTFGNTKFNPRKLHNENMNNNKLGIEFRTVTFGSSSAIAKGIIAGDIDVGLVAYGDAVGPLEKGSIKCTHSTGDYSHGEVPLVDFIGPGYASSFQLRMTVWTRNMSSDQNAEFIKKLQPLKARLEKQAMNGIKIGMTPNDVADFINDAKSLEFTE